MHDEDLGRDVPESSDEAEEPRSRRQLLRLAGLGGAVAAGAVLAGAKPAGAADGAAVLVGGSFSGNTVTTIDRTNATTGGFALDIGQGGGTTFGSGIVGRGTGTGLGISSGVTGMGANGGYGLLGNAEDNADIKCGGTGRFAQQPVIGTNAQPAHQVQGGTDFPFHEIVRSENGAVWASTTTGQDASTKWKRINAVRVDNPNGNGAAFAPFRLVDTRVGEPAVLGLKTKLNSGSSVNLQVTGVGGLPADTIAVFGNVLTVGPTFNGFLKVYPQGITEPTVSNLNFVAGGAPTPNFFFCGLSPTTGQLRVTAGPVTNPGNTDFIIDIFAYVQ